MSPQGTLTLAEHAIGGDLASSQFLSASKKVFGAPNLNGTPLLIDIAKAEAAGARIATVEEIINDLKRFVNENPSSRLHVERLMKIIETTEGEVLIEGKVAGKAVERLSAAHEAYVRGAEELWKKFSNRSPGPALVPPISGARRAGRHNMMDQCWPSEAKTGFPRMRMASKPSKGLGFSAALPGERLRSS